MFPQEMVTTIFSNIKSIYKFHAEFLLPQVSYLTSTHEMMARWRKVKYLPNLSKPAHPFKKFTFPFDQNVVDKKNISKSKLYPQLKERMEKWHDGVEFQRIGDIMVKNAPFLKMYTEYVKNFDTAMNTINTLYSKNSKFAAIVEEIHVSVP